MYALLSYAGPNTPDQGSGICLGPYSPSWRELRQGTGLWAGALTEALGRLRDHGGYPARVARITRPGMDHAELVFVSGHLCPSCERALRQADSGYWVEGPAQDDLLGCSRAAQRLRAGAAAGRLRLLGRGPGGLPACGGAAEAGY